MLNERISAAIADSGLKQRFIAERIGMSEQIFSALLAGKRKVTVEEFFGICQVLNMTPEQLYNYKGRREAV